jgi:hypothetical protein
MHPRVSRTNNSMHMADHSEHVRVKRLLGDMRTERHQVDYRVDRDLNPGAPCTP